MDANSAPGSNLNKAPEMEDYQTGQQETEDDLTFSSKQSPVADSLTSRESMVCDSLLAISGPDVHSKTDKTPCVVNSNFECKMCEKSFSTEAELTQHHNARSGSIYVIGGKSFRDTRCAVTRESISVRENQMNLKCHICEEKFATMETLTHHKQVHSNNSLKIRPFICLLCGKSYFHKVDLSKHERYHTGESPLKCQFCEKHFKTNPKLSAHLRIHTGERPFKCSFCDKSYPSQSSLNYHVRAIHSGPRERPFKCRLCDKTYITKDHLRVHERYHTGERPFKCQLCEKRFIAKPKLSNHLRVHAGERPFKCSSCDKSYSSRNSLNSHVRAIHSETKQRPFKCNHCEKTYITKDHLRVHERYHTA
eukprot:193781_1